MALNKVTYVDDLTVIYAENMNDIQDAIIANESDISDLMEGINQKADAIVNSASGTIVSFDDGADGLPIKQATFYIEPQQSGIGDPSPDNVRPISGYTGMTVQRTGKNRCTPGEFGTVSELSTAGRPYKRVQNASTTRMRSKNLIPVVVGQSFTVSFNSADYYVAFMGFDSNGLYLGRGSSWREFQTASPTSASWANVAYIAIVLRKADNSTMTLEDWDNAQIQVDIGNTATDYEPYIGQTIPIEFPSSAGTVYGGNVVINEDGSGVLTVDKAFYDLSQYSSTSDWSKSTRYLGGFYRNINSFNPRIKQSTTIISCSHAKTVSSVEEYVYGTCFVDSSVNVRIMSEDATVQDWVDYIIAQNNAETPICVVAEIATPLVYNLTAEQITTLLGVNNVWCDTGDTSVEYRADTKLYIDGLIGTTDDDYTASQNIASGQFFSIGNHLYRATSAIASGATIVPGTNCVETNIAEQLTALYASLT